MEPLTNRVKPGPETLFVGVDGGGSTCRVRVRDSIGALRAEGVGAGPANVNLAFEDAVGRIEHAVDEALAAAGVEAGQPVRLVAGLAGVSSPEIGARVRAALSRWDDLAVVSDAVVACRGAHGGADGGLVIAGTGSGAIALVDGRSIAIGGRGFVLGDDGSGARLGLDALRLAIRAHDGLADATPLTRALMARFGDDLVTAIAWGRTARSSDYAALAPSVVEAAAAGDPAGRQLVEGAVAALAALADALLRLGAPRISFAGGLSGVLRPFFPARYDALFQPLLLDALDGALLMAGCGLPDRRDPRP